MNKELKEVKEKIAATEQLLLSAKIESESNPQDPVAPHSIGRQPQARLYLHRNL